MRQMSHKMKQPATRWVLGHQVTPYDTTGDYDLMMAETPPHVPGPPPHLHQSYQESFLILEGEMEFMIDGEIRGVIAGESVDVTPNTMHTFGNNCDQTFKWININSPKGFRSFFETLGIPASEEDAPAKSVREVVINEVFATAADFDMHFAVPQD